MVISPCLISPELLRPYSGSASRIFLSACYNKRKSHPAASCADLYTRPHCADATTDGRSARVNTKRIEKAKIYLTETDFKVYEVADILGFENVTYFSRFFKKHTGMSPKEYKEQKK